MAATKVADFSGYATKAGLVCSDGRTIMPEAFKEMDGKTVPLVWQHSHDNPENVLGHAELEYRPDGVYARAYFNDTPTAAHAKALVQHGDITMMSIFANKLVEKSKQVFHGVIREVSLVLSGANPGALIDDVVITHADGEEEVVDAAVIYSGDDNIELAHADDDSPTVGAIYDSMTEEQKEVVQIMIGAALEAKTSAAHSDEGDPDDESGDNNDNNEDENLTHQEGDNMTRNLFEQNGQMTGSATRERKVLSHDDLRGIAKNAVRLGSLKAAVEDYALAHGIEDIELLFPDAKELNSRPEFIKRETEWVAGVLDGTRHTPMSRIKTTHADITGEEARARGYIKGNFKKEEFFGLARRKTGPTTVYKKQKLDRDDMIDIIDFDVVAWMKAEMNLMIREEIARAILIGDGRPALVNDEPNPDKIKDPAGANEGEGIRAIANDHELYATTVNLNLGDMGNSAMLAVVDAINEAREHYKGSGTPTLYTTQRFITKMLATRDGMQRKMWRTKADLAAELDVANIVPVEVMEAEEGLIGIMVNLTDYSVGTDRGGELTWFDDFDIDYNQHKWLLETRVSGALTKLKSALVLRAVEASDELVEPEAPSFNATTGVVTVPSTTGVVYKNAANGNTLTAGAQSALSPGQTLAVVAEAEEGYYFSTNADDEWSFTRPQA